MKRIFVCSPYSGDVKANVALAVALCREVALRGDAPLAPHLYLPQALDDADPAERRLGMAAGVAWLQVADEIMIAGAISPGMHREIVAADQLGLPIRFRERRE